MRIADNGMKSSRILMNDGCLKADRIYYFLSKCKFFMGYGVNL